MDWVKFAEEQMRIIDLGPHKFEPINPGGNPYDRENWDCKQCGAFEEHPVHTEP